MPHKITNKNDEGYELTDNAGQTHPDKPRGPSHTASFTTKGIAMWPTKNRRPIRRATFGHAAAHDAYIQARRYEMRAAELAQVDWLLYRTNCNPFTRGRPAWRAYNRAFNAERRDNPHPGFPPIPDLPRARRTRAPKTTP